MVYLKGTMQYWIKYKNIMSKTTYGVSYVYV